jgi:hypothetical protein
MTTSRIDIESKGGVVSGLIVASRLGRVDETSSKDGSEAAA